MKHPRMKQALTTAPKKGKMKSAGHALGNIFESNPKKPAPDPSPRTRAGERSARRMRLTNKFI